MSEEEKKDVMNTGSDTENKEMQDAMPDFKDDEEPIDTIEKTVEELRGRYGSAAPEGTAPTEEPAETAGTDENAAAPAATEQPAAEEHPMADIKADEGEEVEDVRLNIPDFKPTEKEESRPADKAMDAALDSLKEGAGKTVDTIRKGVSETFSQENVDKTLDFLKKNAVKAVGSIQTTYDSIRNSDVVQENVSKAQDAARDLGDQAKRSLNAAGDAIKDASSSAAKNFSEKVPYADDLKNGMDKASDAVTKAGETIVNGAKTAGRAVNDYFEKPEVKENLNKAQDAVKNAANKTAEAVSKVIDSISKKN